MTLAPTLLGDWHRLAGDHGLVDGAAAFDNGAIHWHLLAGAHAQAVADMHAVELHLLLRPVATDAASGLRREVEKRADGSARAFAGPQLQHLPEKDEDGDDRRRLEVDCDRPLGLAEGSREDAWRERRDDAVDPGDARAHGDQREHVQVARDQRLPAAHEEWPAAPQHDGRRQDHLNPVRRLLRNEVIEAGQVTAHLQGDHRQRQHQPDPEPARHVDEFVARLRSAVASTGSSAMPQIGQEPGPTWRISGCIGQV